MISPATSVVEIIINYKINWNHGVSSEHPVTSRNDWFEFLITPTEPQEHINHSLASILLSFMLCNSYTSIDFSSCV
jgi:hypothetical protein